MSPWWPASVLVAGIALTTLGIRPQIAMPLAGDLGEMVPRQIEGWHGTDHEVSQAEQRVAGMDDYVLRLYAPPAEAAAGAAAGFSVYVGYYRRQAQGRTIHSPKNCLPGGGWEPLVSTQQLLQTAGGTVPVNHYLIANGRSKAVVLYWYQGRGRVAANEYLVKLELLRDQALLGRSDEALVRVFVPVTTTVEAATAHAERIAQQLVPEVDRALPPRTLRT
jgi:EpsI family protein